MTLERFCVVMGMLLLVELGLLFHIQPRTVERTRVVRVVVPSAPAPTTQPSLAPPQLAVASPSPPVPSRPTPKPVEPKPIPGASDCEHPDDPLCGLPELR